MENPIKDNRIVIDIKFATALRDFVESVRPSDFVQAERKKLLISEVQDILKYQAETATDEKEIEFLKRNGSYLVAKENKLVYETADGYKIYSSFFDELKRVDSLKIPQIFSVMELPQRSDAVMSHDLINENFFDNVNPNRLFFNKKENAQNHYDNYVVQYSKNDIDEIVEATISVYLEEAKLLKKKNKKASKIADEPKSLKNFLDMIPRNPALQQECNCPSCEMDKILSSEGIKLSERFPLRDEESIKNLNYILKNSSSVKSAFNNIKEIYNFSPSILEMPNSENGGSLLIGFKTENECAEFKKIISAYRKELEQRNK